MGSATAQAQNLADELGLAFDKARFEYGDSSFPGCAGGGRLQFDHQRRRGSESRV